MSAAAKLRIDGEFKTTPSKRIRVVEAPFVERPDRHVKDSCRSGRRIPQLQELACGSLKVAVGLCSLISSPELTVDSSET